MMKTNQIAEQCIFVNVVLQPDIDKLVKVVGLIGVGKPAAVEFQKVVDVLGTVVQQVLDVLGTVVQKVVDVLGTVVQEVADVLGTVVQ